MLERRPNCELCDKDLNADSNEAMICAFECTFCKDCVDTKLMNVCPNCGGGFEKRPIMPKEHLAKYPPSKKRVLKTIDKVDYQQKLDKYKDIDPNNR